MDVSVLLSVFVSNCSKFGRVVSFRQQNRFKLGPKIDTSLSQPANFVIRTVNWIPAAFLDKTTLSIFKGLNISILRYGV